MMLLAYCLAPLDSLQLYVCNISSCCSSSCIQNSDNRVLQLVLLMFHLLLRFRIYSFFNPSLRQFQTLAQRRVLCFSRRSLGSGSPVGVQVDNQAGWGLQPFCVSSAIHQKNPLLRSASIGDECSVTKAWFQRNPDRDAVGKRPSRCIAAC